MPYEVQFKVTCCICKREQVVQCRNVPVDALMVKVPNPPSNWTCDGLGGWMCDECYKKWSKQR